MISVTSMADKSAFSFSSQGGIMSSPADLAEFSAESFLSMQISKNKG